MKTRFIALLSILGLAAVAALAEGPASRTIVIKDGKVIQSDGNVLELDGDLLGGRRAFLGVSLFEISPELREHFGATKSAGVLVGSVEDGSPADSAGIRVGDVIVAVEGKDIESSWGLRRALRDKKEGDSVRIDVIRNRARQTIVATLTEREGPKILNPTELRALPGWVGTLDGADWRARIERLGDCSDLQTRIKDLESRLKELEKKMQK
jgi:membrane-associated protease RseP (regulator of RpoE activity)